MSLRHFYPFESDVFKKDVARVDIVDAFYMSTPASAGQAANSTRSNGVMKAMTIQAREGRIYLCQERRLVGFCLREKASAFEMCFREVTE